MHRLKLDAILANFSRGPGSRQQSGDPFCESIQQRLQKPLFTCFSSRSRRPNSISPIPKHSDFKNVFCFTKLLCAKMLCFTVLSDSLPCAIVSECMF